MCCHLFGIIGKRQIYNALTILCLYMKTIEIEDGYFFFIRKLSGSRCFNTAVIHIPVYVWHIFRNGSFSCFVDPLPLVALQCVLNIHCAHMNS